MPEISRALATLNSESAKSNFWLQVEREVCPSIHVMSTSPFTIYLWQQADEFRSVCSFLAISSFVGLVLAIVVWAVGTTGGEDPEARRMVALSKVAIRICAFIAVPFGAIRTITPTSDTIAMMVVIPQITQSSVVQKDIPELYRAAVEALKNQLKQ